MVVLNKADLFDYTVGYEAEPPRMAEGLNPYEVEQARMIFNIFNGLWGLVIMLGKRGTGKDLFGNFLTYRIKRYFPWKKILRDEKPRELFGEYTGLFNDSVLKEDLARMGEKARGSAKTERDVILDREANEWVTSKGNVLLKNSVLYLTEFWRYCYNREPHNPMNKTMGAINKLARHLDCLVLGTTILEEELDKKTALENVTWKIIGSMDRTIKMLFVYRIYRVSYDSRSGRLINTSSPFILPFDAGKPCSFMGDGKIRIKKFEYRPENEEERVVLTALKSGVEYYEDLVGLLETYGDMEEANTLATLKELKFRQHKRVIWYPCDVELYNSKSATEIKTNLKG